MSARVLIGCEFSGTVGAAFLDRGFDVMTCDLRRTERPDVPHYMGDVFNAVEFWRPALLIAHPPCTYLSGSGARWLTQVPARPRPGVLYGEARQRARDDAVAFVRRLMDAPVVRIGSIGWHRARTGNASGRGRIRASRRRWLTSGER